MVSSKVPPNTGSESSDNTIPPSALLVAIDQFNRGEYYEAHETLEELWLEEESHLRSLYQGILQVGAGLYHWDRGNYPGADALLQRGLTLLRPFSPFCHGLDIDRLVGDAYACHGELRRLGALRMARYDSDRFPRIYFSPNPNDKESIPFV